MNSERPTAGRMTVLVFLLLLGIVGILESGTRDRVPMPVLLQCGMSVYWWAGMMVVNDVATTFKSRRAAIAVAILALYVLAGGVALAVVPAPPTAFDCIVSAPLLCFVMFWTSVCTVLCVMPDIPGFRSLARTYCGEKSSRWGAT